ncbi:MAG: hypothetical protein GWN46_13940 [Gammaproteobacteria bacterium]|nr:hypothetical protein [Gammaproteobacteria bacterium]
MKTKIVALVATLVVMLAGTGVAFAHGEEEHGQTTVRGEILDMACYVAHEAKGPDHAACAERCVKGGQPMGLLAEDGTVYLLYANHKDGSAFEQAKEFAGQNVEIVGIAATRAGIKGLEVSGVKKL